MRQMKLRKSDFRIAINGNFYFSFWMKFISSDTIFQWTKITEKSSVWFLALRDWKYGYRMEVEKFLHWRQLELKSWQKLKQSCIMCDGIDINVNSEHNYADRRSNIISDESLEAKKYHNALAYNLNLDYFLKFNLIFL